MCSAVPVTLATRAEDDYLITANTLRESLLAHPRVKALILCNPSNPTGAVAGEASLREIAKVLEEFPQVLFMQPVAH